MNDSQFQYYLYFPSSHCPVDYSTGLYILKKIRGSRSIDSFMVQCTLYVRMHTTWTQCTTYDTDCKDTSTSRLCMVLAYISITRYERVVDSYSVCTVVHSIPGIPAKTDLSTFKTVGLHRERHISSSYFFCFLQATELSYFCLQTRPSLVLPFNKKATFLL